MRVLLDTNVFLWLQTEPERVGRHADLLADPRVDLLVSAVSAWEIAIKHGIGRLPLPLPPAEYVPSRIAAIGARAVAIEHAHALAVAGLPRLHPDPFDRLLVAQSKHLGVPLVTGDAELAAYDIEVLSVP